MTHSKAKRSESIDRKEEKRELCFFFLRLSERLFVFCPLFFAFFHFFVCRSASFFIIFTHAHFLRRL
jgi:hypothetical protein